MILLNATDISKSYTASPLLSNLSYAINEGDKIGLIGVNGTGKSTLLRITAGVEDADSGKIILTGGVRIGYLPQAPAYDPEKTVLEQAVSYLTRQTAEEGEYKCKSMLNQLGITDFEKKMSTLSGGERKRVAMAGIFTNECDILILDEPTNGLDPSGIHEIRNLIKLLPDLYDCTILISSHMLSEIELMADDIGILNHGRLLFEGSLDSLRQNAMQSGFAADNLEDMFLNMVDKDNASRKQRAVL